jgi:NitT/TauT family transport system substrate-binding protein
MQWIAMHSAEQIADVVPRDYYEGNRDLYVAALAKNKTMFTPNGRMPDGGPEGVLKVLSEFSASVQDKHIDLSRTYTTAFVDAALRAAVPAQ